MQILYDVEAIIYTTCKLLVSDRSLVNYLSRHHKAKEHYSTSVLGTQALVVCIMIKKKLECDHLYSRFANFITWSNSLLH